jgi:hypothetical protein
MKPLALSVALVALVAVMPTAPARASSDEAHTFASLELMLLMCDAPAAADRTIKNIPLDWCYRRPDVREVLAGVVQNCSGAADRDHCAAMAWDVAWATRKPSAAAPAPVLHHDRGATDLCPKPRRMTEDGCQ